MRYVPETICGVMSSMEPEDYIFTLTLVLMAAVAWFAIVTLKS